MALSFVNNGAVIIDSASTATTTMVSVSHTPPNDSLLVVIVTGVWAVLNGTLSISNTHAGTSAWTEFTIFNGNVSGETARTSIFVARCGHAPGAGTITVTRSGGTVQCGLESDFLSVSGSIGIATLAQNATATTATASLAITFARKPATASLVIGGVMDIAAATPGATPPASFTEQRDVRDVQLVNHEFATQNAGSPVINPTWTALDTTAGSWGVAVEIAEAMMPLGRPRAVRRTLPRIRTRAATVVPPQQNPVIAPPKANQHRPLATLLRRGRAVTPVLAQQAPPTNPAFAQVNDQHRSWALLRRRGRAVSPLPSHSSPVHVAPPRRKLPVPVVRRGRAVTPVPAQQTPPTNPAFAQVNDQHRLWAGWLRRSRAVTPVPPQLNPPLPLPPPQRHRLAALLRRGGRTAPVPAQDRQQPLERIRRPAPTVRRGTRAQPLPSHGTPLHSMARRPQRILRSTPRRRHIVPASAVVTPNPALPTKTATIRRIAGWLLRRSRSATPPWIGSSGPPPAPTLDRVLSTSPVIDGRSASSAIVDGAITTTATIDGHTTTLASLDGTRTTIPVIDGREGST